MNFMIKQSLAQRFLPEELWVWLSARTSYGTTIYDCIKSGIENPDSKVGLYAPDPEVYDVFANIFNPVISEYHKVEVPLLEAVHDFGDAARLEDMPIEYADKIVSTRARVGRNVKGFPMASKLTRDKRLELESMIKEALCKLDGDLAGTYKSLTEMSYDERNRLIEEHILYNDADDKYLKSAGGYSDWPIGRGVYMNKARNFIVWVNEEDHIRIISLQKGANLKEVWSRLTKAVNVLQTKLDFVHHQRFGYLSFCPTNIGTSLRASVHVKLPKTADSGRLREVCESLELQARGVHGEHTESIGGVYDISNKIRIGRTEWELINNMWIGIKKLLDIELEK